MTVQELINKLQKVKDKTKDVYFEYYNNDYSRSATESKEVYSVTEQKYEVTLNKPGEFSVTTENKSKSFNY